MNGAEVLDIMKDTVWLAMKVSMPLLLTALVVGLIISLVQALTQIQEMTLTFVPKFIAILAVMVFAMPFIAESLEAFTHKIFDKIINI